VQDLNWFALQVRPRLEKIVFRSLIAKGYETFLPLYERNRRWSDRIKKSEIALFEGYLFCRLNAEMRLPVLLVPGAIRFVGIGKTPAVVDDSEIATLQAVARSGTRVTPWPFLQVGQRLRIERGPLRDLEGIVISCKGSRRLIVSVSLLQRSVAVELDREAVHPLAAIPPQIESHFCNLPANF
jgi:transcription antitermination factor NusG